MAGLAICLCNRQSILYKRSVLAGLVIASLNTPRKQGGNFESLCFCLGCSRELTFPDDEYSPP